MPEKNLHIGMPTGVYAERSKPRPKKLDQFAERALNPLTRRWQTRKFDGVRMVQAVNQLEAWAKSLSDTKIHDTAMSLSVDLRSGGFADPPVARAFALVREAAQRTVGQRHFDVQLQGGLVLLRGMIAEMETGEGKTLTATLPACAAALAGIPVHIITVNDYLAQRDALEMKPIYRMLGLTVGVVVQGMETDARRSGYSAHVTYCTNKDVAFDYLRDRIALGRDAGYARLQVERLYRRQPRAEAMILRGLYYGIVDEADSVLIDEAKTPLIISGPRDSSKEDRLYRTAYELTEGLRLGEHFALAQRERAIRLLPAGVHHLEKTAPKLGELWARRQWREELVRQALSARHLFLRDKHYLVKDEKIQIIDEFTGRVMPDRSWEHGLHQMIEVKESCPLTQRIDPLARISYQRFFRRYLRLAGMTGTAREVKAELWSVYRLATVTIPTNRPVRRQRCPGRICATLQEKWQAVLERILEIHRSGRPILVGTRTVAASEELRDVLMSHGTLPQVLNARQDKEEADIVACAGEAGKITVATNMAGRGTDIKLGPGVKELGGLHVIATELHEASRIDRQLFGRCGRQGDPGSYEAVISLEDELVRNYAPKTWNKLLARGENNSAQARRLTVRLAQQSAERENYRARRDLLKNDEQVETALAFSGKGE